jgi:predicted ABC-type ATPase
MDEARPSVVVIAGPNGSGKSTAAPELLNGVLGVSEFVNADIIAQGLSAFNPERAAMAAGRIMLARIKELAHAHVSFAFETTLASRSFAPWISDLIAGGYDFRLVFLWLPSPEMALERVAQRVREGGHHVPDEIVRRRYIKGLGNLFALYQPLAIQWRIYDAAQSHRPKLIAEGRGVDENNILDQECWQAIQDRL